MIDGSPTEFWSSDEMCILRPFFFDYLVYGSADPIFQDLEKKKKLIFFKNIFFLIFFFIIFFFYTFSVAGKSLATQLWSPVENEREWHWDKETTVKDGKKQGMWTRWWSDNGGSRAEAWTAKDNGKW